MVTHGFTREDLNPQTRAEAVKTDDEIVARYKDWIKSVKGQSVSRFEKFDNEGLNLVCLPFGKNNGTIVVAAVPVEKIKGKFLAPLNKVSSTGAFLINESLTTMVTSHASNGLVGTNLDLAEDPQVREAIAAFKNVDYRGSQTINKPFRLGTEQFSPSILTAAPVEVAAGRKWFLLVASPLSEVDSVVGRLFRRILFFGIFVVVAMTAILVSTAAQMIRGRMKLERMRHETITKELDRARQIQKAWLPRKGPRRRSSSWRPLTTRPSTSAAIFTTGSTSPTAAPRSASAT